MSDCSTYPLEKIKKLEERIKELENEVQELECRLYWENHDWHRYNACHQESS